MPPRVLSGPREFVALACPHGSVEGLRMTGIVPNHRDPVTVRRADSDQLARGVGHSGVDNGDIALTGNILDNR